MDYYFYDGGRGLWGPLGCWLLGLLGRGSIHRQNLVSDDISYPGEIEFQLRPARLSMAWLSCTHVHTYMSRGMYMWTCVHAKMPSMGKKRLVIDLNDVDHAELVRKSRIAALTVSNYVRKSPGLPLERQGVKRSEV